MIYEMFSYLKDGKFVNSIALDDLKYFGHVKALIKEAIYILEQQLFKQHDTITKINFIGILILIGNELNDDLLYTKDYLTDVQKLEMKKELNEICGKLSLNFKELFYNNLNVQKDNCIPLFTVIKFK